MLGAGAWAATFASLGYVFWQSFDKLTTYVSRGLFAFGTVVAVGVALVLPRAAAARPGAARAGARVAATSARTGRGWRPVARVAGPLWRVVGRPAAGGADATARFGLAPADARASSGSS